MREIRPSGSEGGVRFKPSFLPLSRQAWPGFALLFVLAPRPGLPEKL